MKGGGYDGRAPTQGNTVTPRKLGINQEYSSQSMNRVSNRRPREGSLKRSHTRFYQDHKSKDSRDNNVASLSQGFSKATIKHNENQYWNHGKKNGANFHQQHNQNDRKRSSQVESFKNLPEDISPGIGLPRRPFLHIIVLFASDPRVMSYSESVARKFLDAGIDVWLMTELSNFGLTNHRHHNRWIKPEHLVSIITSSKSDSLIVLGDRNMKNETCQERISGKLVEVPLEQTINGLLQLWSKETGLRYFKPIPNFYKRKGVKIVEEKLITCVRDITGSCGHALNRIERILDLTLELEKWSEKAYRSRAGKTLTGTHDFSLSDQDQNQIAKLTRNQNAAIKLDTELTEAKEIITRFGVFDANDTRENVDVFIIDLGLGRGQDVTTFESSYEPTEPLVVDKDFDDSTIVWCAISSTLKHALLKVIESYSKRLEDLGSTMTSIAKLVGGVSLWSEHHKAAILSRKLSEETSQATSQGGEQGAGNLADSGQSDEEKTLCAMGFEIKNVRIALKQSANSVENALNLLLQGPLGDSNTEKDEDDGWSMTGQAGKLQRQKKKQEQERQEKIRMQRRRQAKELEDSRKLQSIQRNMVTSSGPSPDRPLSSEPANESAVAVSDKGKSLRTEFEVSTTKSVDSHYFSETTYSGTVDSKLGTQAGGRLNFVSDTNHNPIKAAMTTPNDKEMEKLPFAGWGREEASYPFSQNVLSDETRNVLSSTIPGESSTWGQNTPFGNDVAPMENRNNASTGKEMLSESASFLLPSFLPVGEDSIFSPVKETSMNGNNALSSVPPLDSWLDKSVEDESDMFVREHASSLDELVKSVNTSSLKAGAEEFVPMVSRSAISSDPKLADWASRPNTVSANQSFQPVEFGGFEQNSTFLPPQRMDSFRRNQISQTLGNETRFSAEHQSVWQQPQQFAGAVAENHRSSFISETFVNPSARNREESSNGIEVAFKQGAVNLSKHQDDISRLYNTR